MGKLWKDECAGRIILMSTAAVGDEEKIIRTPSMRTVGELPGRTFPIDKRRISDVRLANAWGDKHDYPTVKTPRTGTAIARIWKMGRSYARSRAKIRKRDVGTSIKRISDHPDTCVAP